jgi:hypothetical protein
MKPLASMAGWAFLKEPFFLSIKKVSLKRGTLH